jgi:integrase
MNSFDVRVYDIVTRSDRALVKPHRVRWKVGHKRFEKSFSTKRLADSFRNQLLAAERAGRPFDGHTGLPEEERRRRLEITWFAHACDYMEMKWTGLAAKSRCSTAEALTTVTLALTATRASCPDAYTMRRALRGWAFNFSERDRNVPPEIELALEWIQRNSLPLARLTDREIVRRALDACARKLDGSTAAATTTLRKRAVLYNALGHAVERDLLAHNPVDRLQWKAPIPPDCVDRRVVANTAQVERILAEVPKVGRYSQHYVAFFACMYYAGMRPSEVSLVTSSDCHLPSEGWGRIDIVETAPRAGSLWTDDGSPYERRGLKHRGRGDVRPVPIPPELVRHLTQHLAMYGTAPDGRIFRGARGGYVSDSVYERTWKLARKRALSPQEAASPLVKRPYDLRHAAVSLWLNGGVLPPEVARRAGHGVAVLHRVYANCIDGDEPVNNEKIAAALQASRTRHGNSK